MRVFAYVLTVGIASGAFVGCSMPALADATQATSPVASAIPAPTAPSATVMPSPAATPPAATAPVVAQNNATDSNEIVCKTMAPPTGTLLGGRRICRTEKEWRDQMERDQQATRNAQIKDRTFKGE
jgi:hypothetical protein